MQTSRVTPLLILDLKRELQQVRKASLMATRTGDFLKVAKLTTQAAKINKEIMEAEGQLLSQL